MATKSPKLKISFITNPEANKNLEKWFVNMVAESIYNEPEFQTQLQKALNPSGI